MRFLTESQCFDDCDDSLADASHEFSIPRRLLSFPLWPATMYTNNDYSLFILMPLG
jgi:hypothetical protein